MPWVTRNGERNFEPRPPIPSITPAKPPFPDLEFRDRYPREQRAHLMWWRRHIAEYVELYLDCPRLACRRNKACEGQDVPCHDQWEALRGNNRAMFLWPAPGEPRREGDSFPQDVEASVKPPETFVLLVLRATEVESLELNEMPHRRRRWREETGWAMELINP